MNYVEGFMLILMGTLIAGIEFPLITFGIQLIYIIGRQLYSTGYMKGADYRIAGALMYQLANLAAIGLSVKSALSII